jgi:hypothetical protein
MSILSLMVSYLSCLTQRRRHTLLIRDPNARLQHNRQNRNGLRYLVSSPIVMRTQECNLTMPYIKNILNISAPRISRDPEYIPTVEKPNRDHPNQTSSTSAPQASTALLKSFPQLSILHLYREYVCILGSCICPTHKRHRFTTKVRMT